MLLELTVAEQRFNAVMEVIRDGLTVIEVADRYGVSRQAVHGWLGHYRTGGLDALADRSHRPNTCPHQMSAEVEARICELRRRHPGWGQRRLTHELIRDGVDPPPGLTSSYRALVRNGLIEPRLGGDPRPPGGAGNGPVPWSCGSWTSWVDLAHRWPRAQGRDRHR
ncbi:MAG TPA: helix-turn-helix domain-containing protein [Actinomycetes bacterium]|nr:helix-turn-helix domain-containing protein [Actinomycetes bacterium]